MGTERRRLATGASMITVQEKSGRASESDQSFHLRQRKDAGHYALKGKGCRRCLDFPTVGLGAPVGRKAPDWPLVSTRVHVHLQGQGAVVLG